ncbi:MAG: hypothetical protein IPO77_17870 [Acidobacteria bacterium]|nr:hypothetical protein [Acidobacteriota bacterium]
MASISRTGRLIAVVILVAAVVLLLQQGQLMRAQKKDYLSRELRGRVEKLKVEAAAPSETPAVLVGRLQTLWEWVNAWALTGGKVPVDIPAGDCHMVPPATQCRAEYSGCAIQADIRSNHALHSRIQTAR